MNEEMELLRRMRLLIGVIGISLIALLLGAMAEPFLITGNKEGRIEPCNITKERQE